MTAAELRSWGRESLSVLADLPKPSKVCPEILHRETDILLAAVLGLDDAKLYTSLDKNVGKKERSRFESYIERRITSEPLAYILGRKEFYSREFLVEPGVLIPRPETELLVDKVLQFVRDEKLENFTILEAGVGSGAIILTLALEFEVGNYFGFDLSLKALEVAKKNRAVFSLEEKVTLFQSDVRNSSEIESTLGAIQEPLIIVSNPPYISTKETLPKDVLDFEPSEALFAGSQGLDIIRELLKLNRSLPSTLLFFEVGYNQRAIVSDLLEGENFSVHQDLAGRDRLFEVRK